MALLGILIQRANTDARPFCNAIRAGVIVPVLGQNVKLHRIASTVTLERSCCGLRGVVRFTRHLIRELNAS